MYNSYLKVWNLVVSDSLYTQKQWTCNMLYSWIYSVNIEKYFLIEFLMIFIEVRDAHVIDILDFKASAHSFKQFTSRLLKLSFSLSMHLCNSDGRHAWFHLHGTSRPDRSASEATKYKMKNSLSTVGLEPSTLRVQVWYSTYWASRAWWMLSV